MGGYGILAPESQGARGNAQKPAAPASAGDFATTLSERMDPYMEHKTTHKEHLAALRRIEGQVKGIQRMVEDEKYCIDIVIQIHAAINALYRVAEKIFARHIEHCVVDAFKGKSEREKIQKIDEVMEIIKRLHKLR